MAASRIANARYIIELLNAVIALRLSALACESRRRDGQLCTCRQMRPCWSESVPIYEDNPGSSGRDRTLIFNQRHLPHNAGRSSRTDFFIKVESTVIEVKVTRPGRGERQIRDEIIVDQRTYQSHPGAQRLIAVVYDLANTFTNPVGFEDDLSQHSAGLQSTVLVVRWAAIG